MPVLVASAFDFHNGFRVQIGMESGPFEVKQEDRWYSMEDFMN